MSRQTQIAARIDESTKLELDAYAEEHGLKQGHLIEQALRHHLRALKELPADVIVPTRLVVTRESGEKVLELLRSPARPNRALRELMHKR
jgi:hypothetical protein